MKLSVLVVSVVLAAGFVVTQQPTTVGPHEAIVKEMLATIDDINKILKTIQDSDTATVARPELKKNGDKMVELQKQATEGMQPTKDEKDRLAKEYAPKMDAAFKKFNEESIRVKAIAGGKEALAELPLFLDKEDKAKIKKDGK
ncbi:MAG TPA: hypothetical protein VE988_06430 [Gemmataceae bacterium]|nr:hypothetical protein [Gemmataceae bacterium]